MSKKLDYISENNELEYLNEKTILISDILFLIANQLKIIIIIPLLVVLSMIFWILFFSNSVYISEAKIMSSSNNISQASGIAAQFGLNIPTTNSDPQWVYPEIIKSRTLARRMLKRKFNTNIYGPEKTLLQILTYGNNKPDIDSNSLIKSGIDNFINMISINEESSFYNLVVSGPEPQFVSDVATILIEELDKYQREYNKKKKNEIRTFIESRIEETRRELTGVEEKLRNFTERNRRIENSPALQLEQQRLGREVSVLIGVFTTLKQQLETTKIEQVKDFENVIVLDPPESPLYPSKPKKKLLVVFSFIVGFVLSLIIALIRESFSKIKDEESIRIREAKKLLLRNLFSKNIY